MRHSRHLRLLARGGYAARGIVYMFVAVFAALAALGSTEPQGSQGALRTLLAQPFGTALVALMVVGLLSFAGWRFAQSLLDADRQGTGVRALAVRLGLLGSAIAHLALAALAGGMLVGARMSGGGGDPTRGWVQALLGQGWGRWIALAFVAAVGAVGAAHVVKGARAGFEKWLVADEETMAVLRPICSAGLIARGIVFLVVAALAFAAGGMTSADDAPGIREALDAIQSMPFGWLLLLALAAGLLAFSAYSFVEALYRRVSLH